MMAEGVRVEYPIEVVWDGDRRYRGGPVGGPTLLLDGNRVDAPSPVDSLLVAMASCAAIDIVEILEKRRTPATSLSIRVEFSRAASPPRRLTEARVLFRVATASEVEPVARAAALSFEKYCSVSSSLAPDTELTWEVDVQPPAENEAA